MIKNIEQYADLFKENPCELARKMDELPEDFLNSYIIYTCYYNQYAAGITGYHKVERFLVNENGIGYPYAAAAYKDAKEHGIKPYEKKGHNDYWNVGLERFMRKAMTVREALSMKLYVFSFDCMRKVA